MNESDPLLLSACDRGSRARVAAGGRPERSYRSLVSKKDAKGLLDRLAYRSG
jgi:hypothetical protein